MPDGILFLSNISEHLNWTKRLWLYSIPVSLKHVFGLVVLLGQFMTIPDANIHPYISSVTVSLSEPVMPSLLAHFGSS